MGPPPPHLPSDCRNRPVSLSLCSEADIIKTAREMFCVLQSQVTTLFFLLTLQISATPDPALRVRVPGLRWPARRLGHCTLTPYTLIPPGLSALCLLLVPVSRPLNSKSLVHCLVGVSYIRIHSGSTILEISRNSKLQWMPNPVGFHILMDVYLVFILSESFYWQSLIWYWIFERIMHFLAMSLNFHVEDTTYASTPMPSALWGPELCQLIQTGNSRVSTTIVNILQTGKLRHSETLRDLQNSTQWVGRSNYLGLSGKAQNQGP